MNNHVTVLEIDGSALEHNLNYFKQKLNPETKILAVVKAFGYGSDGVQVAQFLQNKVDYFAVAYAHEGIALREANVKTPILVLHPQIQNLQAIVDYKLEPNLYNFKIFDAFLELADRSILLNYPVHLKFNTGLNRLGFSINDMSLLATKLKENNRVVVKALFSHLAASEDLTEKEFTQQQIATFKHIASDFESEFGFKPRLHLCNTSGTLNYPEAHFDMVRIGIGLYGFGNSDKITHQLKNVISLHLSLIHI